jgi:hypothetical protein
MVSKFPNVKPARYYHPLYVQCRKEFGVLTLMRIAQNVIEAPKVDEAIIISRSFVKHLIISTKR